MQTTNRDNLTGAASERGFMMVALLVGMAVAAIYMTAALPAWRQQAQRQKEEDLIFRGEQYARAIMLFQDKNRQANPPDIDTLVSQHFLRKKWKDPVTGEDFVPVGIGIAAPTQPGQSSTNFSQTPGRAGQPGAAQPVSGQQPGITGVRSKSTATSIKIYQNQQQYNLWQFDAQLYRVRLGRIAQQQGGGRPSGPQGGDRGGQQVNPGRGGQGAVPGGRPGGPGPIFVPGGAPVGGAPPPSRPGGSAGSGS